MRRHGPVIAHCTDSEDFPNIGSHIAGEKQQTAPVQAKLGQVVSTCVDLVDDCKKATSDGTIYRIVSNIAILRSYRGISLSR